MDIVIGDAEAIDIMGHILIDLEAEYNPPFLECPAANCEKDKKAIFLYSSQAGPEAG